jgi:hypothetical protein
MRHLLQADDEPLTHTAHRQVRPARFRWTWGAADVAGPSALV